MIARTTRWLFLLAGWLCLALGAIGVFLPILPTTPFVLLAAWCFSRGSDRMHRWLLSNPTFGPSIRAWEEHRVIPLRIKVLASSLMLIFSGYMLVFTDAPRGAKVLASALVAWGLAFIWTQASTSGISTPIATDAGDSNRSRPLGEVSERLPTAD